MVDTKNEKEIIIKEEEVYVPCYDADTLSFAEYNLLQEMNKSARPTYA